MTIGRKPRHLFNVQNVNVIQTVDTIVTAKNKQTSIDKGCSVAPTTARSFALSRHQRPRALLRIQLPNVSEQTLIIASSKYVNVLSKTVRTVTRTGLGRRTLQVRRTPSACVVCRGRRRECRGTRTQFQNLNVKNTRSTHSAANHPNFVILVSRRH